MIPHVPMQTRSLASYSSSFLVLEIFTIRGYLTTSNSSVHTLRLQSQVDNLNYQQHINLLIDCQHGVSRSSHASLDIAVLNLQVVKFTPCYVFFLLLFYFILHKSLQELYDTQAVYVMQLQTLALCTYVVILDTFILRIV